MSILITSRVQESKRKQWIQMQIFNKEREKKNPKHEQISRNENVTNNNKKKKKQLTMDTHGNQTLNT